MKKTYDREYEISGWTTGVKGKAALALMIICRSGDKTFPVTPAMELEERNALAKKMKTVESNGKTHFENHWLGRPLIVYFDDYSKDNLPQRARTKMEIKSLLGKKKKAKQIKYFSNINFADRIIFWDEIILMIFF
jgi:hypothetical protein